MEEESMTNSERAKKIKLLLMDVDGVLTDGKMYFIPGKKGLVETRSFHSLDGIGLRLLNGFGILTGVITGRESPGTEERAKGLGMSYVYQGFLSKVEPLKKILAETGLKPENVAYMGDDWTDIPVLRKVGLSCAPSDAVSEVKKIAKLVTVRPGGTGAVREVCEFILKSQGHWKTIMGYIETAHWPEIKKAAPKIVRQSGGKGGR
jgi:3-deoxy-D-manno-octulosonate 8-phosphate phosphatase (KDO 8-P phosphatase)